ncbi:nuclease [Sorangium cellulosum]|uniref:Nuclease n=1 Tax=Sorangium cellulosum TaxID=56 RepID=A0A150TKW8_SORCE|nr:nuclease [Sorangium cellulosum]
MTAIATSEVHAALARAAEQILSAGGADGIISRRDIRAKLLSLEGTERNLVDLLYRTIDSRDAARSARVTKADVDAALAHVRTDVVDRLDLDKNGLSEDEIARMSELGKVAVSLARELKGANAPTVGSTAPAGEPSALTGEALAQKIASLASELYLDDFGSESGMGFAPFHTAAKLSALTADTFRATLGLGDGPKQTITRFEPGDRCLQRIIDVADWEDRRPQGEELVAFMRANLREISAALLGPYDPEQDAEYPVYIVGIDAAGNLVGLKSAAIWT